MIYKGKNEEYLELVELSETNCSILKKEVPHTLTVLWAKEDGTQLNIDGELYTFKKNQLICLTEFHKVAVKHLEAMCMIKFNKSFYCIINHDSEVNCNGLLFFGASQVPVFDLPKVEEEKFQLLWRMFTIEMESKDDLQLEMLQMMLKRLLILCTRLHKEQNELIAIEKPTLDLVREFNFLVETHFKSLHAVNQYADLLFKSPKTLSNVFSKTYNLSPLQFIHNRIILEAKRLLVYTDKPVKEIAYELGFEDIQTFSRLFKKKTTFSPTNFKENIQKGTIANSSGKTA